MLRTACLVALTLAASCGSPPSVSQSQKSARAAPSVTFPKSELQDLSDCHFAKTKGLIGRRVRRDLPSETWYRNLLIRDRCSFETISASTSFNQQTYVLAQFEAWGKTHRSCFSQLNRLRNTFLNDVRMLSNWSTRAPLLCDVERSRQVERAYREQLNNDLRNVERKLGY